MDAPILAPTGVTLTPATNAAPLITFTPAVPVGPSNVTTVDSYTLERKLGHVGAVWEDRQTIAAAGTFAARREELSLRWADTKSVPKQP